MDLDATDHLDLNLLVVFDAIYSAGSVSRAAKSLGMSQPAVSNALSRLREAIGDPLFTRLPRGIEATARARQLIGPVRQALLLVRSQLAESPQFDPGTSQRQFRILMADWLEPIMLPPVIKAITDSAPGIGIDCLRALPNVADGLRAGAVDLACMAFPIEASDIVVTAACRIDPVVVARRDHPRIGATIDASTFTSLDHVALSAELSAMGDIDPILAAVGLRRRVLCLANKIWSIPSMIEHTDLIGILPRAFAADVAENFNLASYELPVKLPDRSIHMFWHAKSNDDPGHRWLRESMLQAVQGGNEQ